MPTVFDFGRKGTPPTHPELLDWLAVELVEHGWSMKHIHRLIVTSNTYRLTSSSAGRQRAKPSPPTPTTASTGERIRPAWRLNSCATACCTWRGELDLTRGGPSIPVTNESSHRRSLYFVHSHNEHEKFLSMFDDASVLECYRRAESIVPQQALALENSPLATAMAEKIAGGIAAANPGPSDGEFIRAAFLTVLSVEPSASEQSAVREALARLTELPGAEGRAEPRAPGHEPDSSVAEPQRFCHDPMTAMTICL